MEIQIKKATIKSSIFLAYNYTQTADNIENQINTKSDAPIHEDLRRAFMCLTPHLAYICEEITKEKADKLIDIMDNEWSLDDESEYYNEELHEFFRKFQTEGFEISGSGEKEGVKIIGAKLLDTNKAISLTTPKQSYEAEYPFSVALSETVEDCRMEVYEYFKGKQAPSQQTEMDFEFSEDEQEED